MSRSYRRAYARTNNNHTWTKRHWNRNTRRASRQAITTGRPHTTPTRFFWFLENTPIARPTYQDTRK